METIFVKVGSLSFLKLIIFHIEVSKDQDFEGLVENLNIMSCH